MNTIICIIWFVVLSYLGFRYVNKPETLVKIPYSDGGTMYCNGPEMLVIFMFTTGLLGILPVLSLRLAVLEILCIIGLSKISDKLPLSFPLKLFVIFLVWLFLGIMYAPNMEFGIRMILKYIYPFLFCLLTMSAVRDKEVFLKCAENSRCAAFIVFIITLLPGNLFIFQNVLWNGPAIATNYICMCVLSLSFVYVTEGKERIKNIIWTLFFILPAIYWVIRTDIFGIGVALSVFFFLKYKIKSLPIILLVGCLGLGAMFYIPSVKKKMYYRPNEVTLTDFLTGNVDEDNINNSGRKAGWKFVNANFYEPHKLTGSGTGRVQTYFYTEAIGWQRGGQLHNDFLVLMCDNGLIGLALFLIPYLAITFHCLLIYNKSDSNIVKICAVTAGASLLGVMVTMYSDNTISYSMATLSYPWGFYGMTLGLYNQEQNT